MIENDKNPNATPEMSLVQTIGKSELSNLAVDASELVLDQLLESGVLQDIPIFGTIVKLAKAGINIRDYLFLKKTFRFLLQLKDIPIKERQQFISQLELDKKLARRVGENLFLLLHRLDDMDKPEILGRIFKAYMKGVIDYSTYQKLAIAVDRIKIYNLPGLIDFYRDYDGSNYDDLFNRPSVDDATIQDLIICGLIDVRFMPGIILDETEMKRGVTELGKLFIEIALQKNN